MKRQLFGLICMVCLALLGMDVAAAAVSFRQLRTANQSATVLDGIKSGRIVYTITGGESKASAFMVRGKSFDKVRLDILTADGNVVCVRNGEDFWMHDSEKGVTSMDAAEKANFTQFIEMLPVPFYSNNTFGTPVFDEEDTEDGETRLKYEVKAKNGDEYEIELDKETKDVLCISYEAKSDDDMSVTYGDYQERKGIRIACRLDIVRPKVRFSMNLVSADWNLELADGLFDRNSNMMSAQAVPQGARAAAVVTVDAKSSADVAAKKAAKAEKLERKIRKLKVELEFNEQKAAKMEQLLIISHDDAFALNMKGNEKDSRRYYWNGYCWNKDRNTGSRKANRDAKKKAEEIEKEMEAVFKEYKDLNKKILKQRTKLSEAELALEKCKK